MHSKNLRNELLESEDSNADSAEVAISPNETMQVSPEAWNAFLEYKKFNDYSNETPKTDYTYSKWSKFRYIEIIPGLVIKPNMSRLPLPSYWPSVSNYKNRFPSRVDNCEISAYKKENTTEIGYDLKTPKQSNSSAYRGSDDFFSASKTILNTIFKGVLFVFSFLYYITLILIPHFLTVTLPNFFSMTVFYYFNKSKKKKERVKFLYLESERSEGSFPYAKVRSSNLDDTSIDKVNSTIRKEVKKNIQYPIRVK